MRQIIMIGSILFLGLQVQAAVSKETAKKSSEVRLEKALRLPLSGRLSAVRGQGKEGYKQLEKMAFDQSQAIEERWKAVTTMGRVYPKESRANLEKAMKSQEWFMRNAALVVVHYGDRAWAVKWARNLLHDPALVVRTASVQALRNLNAKESRDLLWERFSSNENFRSGKSLWIRRHILEVLSEWAEPGQEGRFMQVLTEKDDVLRKLAMQTLKSITKLKHENVADWQNWYQDKSLRRSL